MEIVSKQHDRAVLVSLQGSLDALTAEQAGIVLGNLLEGGHENLVLDLGQVSFMSSSGIRLIVEYLRRSRELGGDLRLAAAQPGVWRSLEISGLNRVLKAYTSIEDAVSSFEWHASNGDEPAA